MDNGKKKTKVSPINGQPVPTNPNGRTKGVPNKATTEFKQGLNNLFEYATPHMVTWLEQIDSPERRFEVLSKFADYLYPKLARTDINHGGQDKNPIQISITHVKKD